MRPTNHDFAEMAHWPAVAPIWNPFFTRLQQRRPPTVLLWLLSIMDAPLSHAPLQRQNRQGFEHKPQSKVIYQPFINSLLAMRKAMAPRRMKPWPLHCTWKQQSEVTCNLFSKWDIAMKLESGSRRMSNRLQSGTRKRPTNGSLTRLVFSRC